MQETPSDALLLRSVLSTAAHDLGGLASALLLRADVLEHGSSESTVHAMRSIANELRELGHDLRALRGDDGAATLAPAKPGASDKWSARITRFGLGLLPRGSTIEGAVEGDRLPPDLAPSLCNVTLALCCAIGEHWPDRRLRVRFVSENRDDVLVFSLSASANNEAVDLAELLAGSWWQFAQQRATQAHLVLFTERGQAVIRRADIAPS